MRRSPQPQQRAAFQGASSSSQQSPVGMGSAALNRPANLKLSGAWAFYESRHHEDSARLRALEKQVRPRALPLPYRHQVIKLGRERGA